MGLLKNKWRISTVLLVVIILVMIVQNLLLVRKNNEYLGKIKELMEETDYALYVHERDTVGAITALNLDSTRTILDPRQESTKTLFFLFATWCHSCKENMGQWNLLATEIPPGVVRVVGVCPDSVYKIVRLKREMQIGFPVVSLADDFAKVKKYKFLSFPRTILIERTGVVSKVWKGILTDEKRKDILKALS